MRSRQSGFTLIEILVVMAIIVSMAGAVMLIVQRGTRESKKTNCMNNLRQMGTVMVANHASGPWPKKSGAGFLLDLWFTSTEVQGDVKVFICPADENAVEDPGGDVHKAMFEGLERKLETWPEDITNYAARLTRSNPLRSSAKENQALACDRNGLTGDDPHHGDGLNVLFEDGKVEYLDRDKLGLGPDEPIILGPGGPTVLEPLGFNPD